MITIDDSFTSYFESAEGEWLVIYLPYNVVSVYTFY